MMSTIKCLNHFAIIFVVFWATLVYTEPTDYDYLMLYERDSNNATDPEDMSWITSWAAIGDSYAAGIGAGNEIDGSCARYSWAYPNLMNEDERMGNGTRTFDFLACSGATTDDVLQNQVPQMKSNYDVITISAGGNDVGLTAVLNACVFQWSGGDDANCDNQLNNTAGLIQNTLPGKLDALLSAVKGKVASGSKIYQTGYAQFFNASTTQCDDVTWSFWYSGLGGWQQQYLTQARRQQMNELVLATNAAIQTAIKNAGSEFTFLDYDSFYDGGRFCEEGVTEPDPNRNYTLFYEWDTAEPGFLDQSGTISKRLEANDSVDATPGTFGGEITDWVNQTYVANPTAQTEAEHNSSSSGTSTGTGTGKTASALEMFSVSSLIPDGYKRVFHPKFDGHAIIANFVFWQITQDRGVAMDIPGYPYQALVPFTASCPMNCTTYPAYDDCFNLLNLQLNQNSSSPVPFSNATAYSNSTYTWRDLYTWDTCQLSIGYGSNQVSPLTIPISQSQLAAQLPQLNGTCPHYFVGNSTQEGQFITVEFSIGGQNLVLEISVST